MAWYLLEDPLGWGYQMACFFFFRCQKKQVYDPEKIVIFLFFVWMIPESLVGRCLDGVFFLDGKKPSKKLEVNNFSGFPILFFILKVGS